MAEPKPRQDGAEPNPADADRADAPTATPAAFPPFEAEIEAEVALVVEAERREKKKKPWWNLPLRIAALVVIAAVVVALLQGQLPSPAQIWQSMIHANWWWIGLGLVLQFASFGMFARQQRQLLGAFGVYMSVPRAEAITYSSTAIANSMPAGAAVAAGYSLQQYRLRGATTATAATVTVLSGVLSIVALGLMYLIGLLTATWTKLVDLAEHHPASTVFIGLGAVLVIVVVIRYVTARNVGERSDAPTPRLDSFEERHPKLGPAARQTLNTLRDTREVRLRDWNLALGYTMVKWAMDAACLWTVCKAFDIDIDLFQLSVLYLGIQLVRQIPLTPGGIGVIEAALLAGLISAGAPPDDAAGAVLVYRTISAYIMIPIGYTVLGFMTAWDRRHARVTPPAEPTTDDDRVGPPTGP